MRRSRRQIGEPDTSRQRIAPGRQTMPRGSSYLGMLPYNYIPRRRYERYDISKFEQSHLSASQLLALLPDVSSDIGLAVWNILRLGSSGFNYTVKDSKGQDDEQGKELLDNLVDIINERGGGFGGLIIQWLLSGFLQGAICGEVSLTESLDSVDDFVVVDPFSIEFRRDENAKLVAYYRYASGGLVALNPSKFWYVPIDPWIDDPYGRPPAAPVLQEVWFDMTVMTDLRKVIHNQGWPRIDIKLLEETLINNAPMDVKRDSAKLAEWLEERLVEVQTAYNNLQPDDSFVHFDSVEIKQSESSGKLFDATGVIRVIERRMIKALKQLPILMASNEGTTETHGTIQWQIFLAGLRSLQQPIEFILERMLQLSLEVQGYQGRVECWFDPIRTTDRKADADAEKIEIENAKQKWLLGFQTWAESAIEVTGSAPPEDAVEPDPSMFANAGIAINTEPARTASTSGVRIDPEQLRLQHELEEWMEGED